MSEVWERIRGRLFGPKGLFSSTPEDEVVMVECQKDIEQLEAALERLTNTARLCTIRDAQITMEYHTLNELNRAMAKLLEKAKHEDRFPLLGSRQCAKECIACAWEAMKKGEPDETRP
jgi:hypothetical protein